MTRTRIAGPMSKAGDRASAVVHGFNAAAVSLDGRANRADTRANHFDSPANGTDTVETAADTVCNTTDSRANDGANGSDTAEMTADTSAKTSDGLANAITTHEQLINTPRPKIVNRSTLLRELETRTAGLLDMLNDLDDLVVQFDTNDLGHRFVSAWSQARIILDLGHRFDTPAPPDPNPPPTP